MLGHVAWLVLLCAALGLVGGVVWEALWRPPLAVVVDGRAVLAGTDAERAFDATAWFLLIGGVAGLLAGVVAGLLVRVRELLTLATLLPASILAGLLMAMVGSDLGPPDPARAAARAEDLARLPVALEVSGPVSYLALPIGAVAGLLLVLVLAPVNRPGSRTSGDPAATMPS